jgi:hypothetical protein
VIVPTGGVKATLMEVELKTIGVPIVGALLELVAVTVNEYIVSGVNPDTVIGEDVPIAISPKLLVTV